MSQRTDLFKSAAIAYLSLPKGSTGLDAAIKLSGVKAPEDKAAAIALASKAVGLAGTPELDTAGRALFDPTNHVPSPEQWVGAFAVAGAMSHMFPATMLAASMDEYWSICRIITYAQNEVHARFGGDMAVLMQKSISPSHAFKLHCGETISAMKKVHNEPDLHGTYKLRGPFEATYAVSVILANRYMIPSDTALTLAPLILDNMEAQYGKTTFADLIETVSKSVLAVGI